MVDQITLKERSLLNKETMKFFFTLWILAFTLVGHGAPTRSIEIVNESSKVEFLAIGKPSLLKIKGTGGILKGKINLDGTKASGWFEVSLEPISTGIGLRDQHMKEKYLEISKFPKATLELLELNIDEELMGTNKATKKALPFKGNVTIHGVTKPITGIADIESEKEHLKVSANLKVAISDFQIEIPIYLGIKVADDVQISAEITAKK